MNSLSSHLCCRDDHGRLAFRADCPVCRRERLVGVLPPVGIVSRRTQALLAGGVLAFSAAVPPAVLAAEPDQERQGSVAPDQPAATDRSGSPAFDPGGTSTDLAVDDRAVAPAPLPPGAGGDDTHALDQEPAADTGAPIVDEGDDDAGSTTEQQPVSVPGGPPPSLPGSPELPVTPNEPVPAALPAPLLGSDKRATHKPHRTRRSKKEHIHRAVGSDSSPTVAPVAARPIRTAVAAGDRAEPGDRFHVVQAGESLWAVAGDLLGGQPSAARIAREVSRLWELNKERIGTGDPDLLMIGTKLRLR